jgi:hypothetical protein
MNAVVATIPIADDDGVLSVSPAMQSRPLLVLALLAGSCSRHAAQTDSADAASPMVPGPATVAPGPLVDAGSAAEGPASRRASRGSRAPNRATAAVA